jgi:hypothetical protein
MIALAGLNAGSQTIAPRARDDRVEHSETGSSNRHPALTIPGDVTLESCLGRNTLGRLNVESPDALFHGEIICSVANTSASQPAPTIMKVI